MNRRRDCKSHAPGGWRAFTDSNDSNLTSANHIIFLSPLLAESQYHYDSTMMQAVRRVRRYGQTKPVYVHRFVSQRDRSPVVK